MEGARRREAMSWTTAIFGALALVGAWSALSVAITAWKARRFPLIVAAQVGMGSVVVGLSIVAAVDDDAKWVVYGLGGVFFIGGWLRRVAASGYAARAARFK